MREFTVAAGLVAIFSQYPYTLAIVGASTDHDRSVTQPRDWSMTTENNEAALQRRSRRIAIQRLQSYRRAGITHWSQSTSLQPLETAAAETEPLDRPLAQPVASEEISQMTGKVDAAAALSIIEQEVRQCEQCVELVAGRTQTVFGDGSPQARLCFLGEAPGRDEDAQGIPFVGRAGKLLNDIIHACTLQREDVYILNVIKCRPPENRNPAPTEAENCRGFLQRQLGVIKPEYICCLGTVAAQNLLDTKETIGRLRGKFHDYQGIKVLATYHPAYLLRNPSAKRQVWDDMKILMQDMGIPIPG